MNEHSDRDKTEPPARDERQQRYAETAVELLELDVRRAHDRMVADDVAAKFMAVADAEQADLRAEIERWRDKAQEAGAAYGNANSKHHAELDRANRLERLADTLAGKAVDLEDRARAAEAKLARVEALAGEDVPEAWVLRSQLRAALDGPTTAS